MRTSEATKCPTTGEEVGVSGETLRTHYAGSARRGTGGGPGGDVTPKVVRGTKADTL